jgi:phenylalanyl-tRNA synthetase beta chain
MRVPLSWLREYAEIPDVPAQEVADALVRAGLEVERVEPYGHDIIGPVVIGQVLDIDEFTASNGKTIRYCKVDVGEDEPRGIVCGARNFAVGDKVVVSLPGAVLPGGFAIAARQTYGHVSDGMICSVRELGVGEEHDGILVVDPSSQLGAAAVEHLGLRDDVLDIAVTPDRGYCFSIRGVAREAAIAFGVPFRDPADVPALGPVGEGHPVAIEDTDGCDRIVLHSVRGFDPSARSPLWLRLRLSMAGMRPVSLAVDITNYVMLELGQPLHAFDAAKLNGPIVVRAGREGEKLETLDHVKRSLHPEDVLITDSSGPLSLAGTMGGVHSEIDATSTDLVIEAAHFSDARTARMSRRHKLSSEASRRFERGVDPQLPPFAATRAVRMLMEMGGASAGGVSEAGAGRGPRSVTLRHGHVDAVAGVTYGPDTVIRRLTDIGCMVKEQEEYLEVEPPSWRPDLTDPNDLAEEVIRLEGYESIPSVLPRAVPGRGLTEEQRLRRRISRALAAAGYVEVLTYPFVSADVWDAFGAAVDDRRRTMLRLANPLSDTEPFLRTSLLPGLLAALGRNVARGQADASVFEAGLVYLPGESAVPPRLGVDRRPTPEEVAAVEAALPAQPWHVAAALSGDHQPAGWWGEGRAADWSDAVEAARMVADAAGLLLSVRAADLAPWHPGRCAALYVGDSLVGHAGELHPRVIGALELPTRTCAMELDLSAVLAHAAGPVQVGHVSTYPVATQDVALVVADSVPAGDVEAALRSGAGPLLESLRLFDVYTGAQVGDGRKSLAYAMRFRAADRTLTVEETTAARDAAVAEAQRLVGAVLRT